MDKDEMNKTKAANNANDSKSDLQPSECNTNNTNNCDMQETEDNMHGDNTLKSEAEEPTLTDVNAPSASMEQNQSNNTAGGWKAIPQASTINSVGGQSTTKRVDLGALAIQAGGWKPVTIETEKQIQESVRLCSKETQNKGLSFSLNKAGVKYKDPAPSKMKAENQFVKGSTWGEISQSSRTRKNLVLGNSDSGPSISVENYLEENETQNTQDVTVSLTAISLLDSVKSEKQSVVTEDDKSEKQSVVTEDEKSEKQSVVTEDDMDTSETLTEHTISEIPVEQTPKQVMLSRICNTDAHFKHQQRGVPDLTYAEKHAIASDLLDTKPYVFLSQFGRYLAEEDLVNFKGLEGDYMIDFHLNEMKKYLDVNRSKTRVKNRRYEAMQQMLVTGDYFSMDSMKHRDPLLYEQMVGQYLTEDEVAAEVDKTDLTFSNILMQHIQVQHDNVLYKVQQDIEEAQKEEVDDDLGFVEDEVEMEEDAEGKPQLSELERQQLKNDFLLSMQHHFLSGKDANFDYSEVDRNAEYDSLDLRERDEEESYFDAD